MITRLICGEPISIEQKESDNTVLIPYATLLFSVNEVVDFKETSLSIIDRFLVIPFNATFIDKKDNRDIDIGKRLCQPKALTIIATRAIQAFNKVLENGKFTIPQSVKEETKKYFRQCNNAVDFCSAYPIYAFIGKRQYYIEYYTWCKKNNLQALDKFNFGKVVTSFGYKSKRRTFNRIKTDYYVNPKFDTSRCYSFYKDFELEQEVNFIKRNMTFEQYLGTLIYIKEQDYLLNLEEQELKKLEPEILLDNT